MKKPSKTGVDHGAGGREEPVGAGLTELPDPEVSERPTRRTFTAKYKLAILEAADKCKPGSGEIGALLRREGLYSSHLTVWRRLRSEGVLTGLQKKRRGPKPRRRDPVALENQDLRRDMARLQERLDQAERIIEIQKKVSEILGIPLSRPENDENA